MIQNVSGAWIFVSHSSRDWIKVREIRNILEDKGHNPLLFHLKCLEDEAEINVLLKREIQARNWFVLCDSKYARASPYVSTEIEYIKSLNDKVFEIIDLEKPINNQLDKLNRLSKRITIFPSYDKKSPNAQEILNLLKKNDYYVYDIFEMRSSENSSEKPWYDLVEEKHNKASQEGFYLLIISKGIFGIKGIGENYKDELRAAIERSKTGANIIIVSLIDPNTLAELMSEELQILISGIKIWDFSKGVLEENTVNLINELKFIEMD